MKYQFQKEWDEDSDISWQQREAKIMNVAIRKFNEWQISGLRPEEKESVDATIEWAKAQFDKYEDDNCFDTLYEMQRFLNKEPEPPYCPGCSYPDCGYCRRQDGYEHG